MGSVVDNKQARVGCQDGSKTMSIPMRPSGEGSTIETTTLDLQLQKTVDNFRLLEGPKAVWARAAAAVLTNTDRKTAPRHWSGVRPSHWGTPPGGYGGMTGR